MATRTATIIIKEKIITKTIMDVEIRYDNGEIVTPEGIERQRVALLFGLGEHKVEISKDKYIHAKKSDKTEKIEKKITVEEVLKKFKAINIPAIAIKNGIVEVNYSGTRGDLIMTLKNNGIKFIMINRYRGAFRVLLQLY